MFLDIRYNTKVYVCARSRIYRIPGWEMVRSIWQRCPSNLERYHNKCGLVLFVESFEPMGVRYLKTCTSFEPFLTAVAKGCFGVYMVVTQSCSQLGC